MARAVDISSLLASTQNADAAVRTQVEHALAEFSRTNVPGFLLSLSTELANAEKAPDSRKMAGIILKNQLDAKDEAKRGGLMAAVNRRSRVLEGECLECVVECFEEAYASEPQRYKNTACTSCFGPLLAPVAVVWVNDIVKKCREPSLEAWDRGYSSVKYCERGDSEKPGVGRLVRGYVILTMRAMELMFGLHNVRQGGKDVGYGNIRRRKNSLKLAVPPATLVETVER
eukprot:jgi/Tetstr1/449764/TSEL_036829.t1